jgi:hypothetical protein
MTMLDLGILYAAGGVVSGIIAHRRAPAGRRRALGNLVLAVCVWPLWLPLILAAPDSRGDRAPNGSSSAELALLEGHEAVRGTPLETLLPRESLERIRAELRRAAERHAELSVLLARASFRLDSARARVEKLEREGASARSLASARLHLDNVERLEALRRRDALALEELGELCSALRTQLVLARYAGSSPAGATDIVSEVCARVEVLGTTMDDLTPLLGS